MHTAAEGKEVLSDSSLAVLSWLARPLQRTEDIAVALRVHPVTVFRHLQRLEHDGLVESITPGTIANSGRLYYLTQAGLLRVARQRGMSPQILAETWGADEAALLRLLPRLSTLIIVQNTINSLVKEAPERLSYPGGQRADLAWQWQRDWRHTFVYKNREVRCAAEAALVFHRFSPQGGPGEYYSLFLLVDAGLHGSTDRLIIQRMLEQFLRYRESAERTAYYRQFPLIAVLVSVPHQQERWQRLALEVATHLRLAPLRGVIACVPPGQALSSAWALPWQHLSQPAPCHLQDLLAPTELAAIPPGILVPRSPEHHHRARPKQRLISGHYAERAAQQEEGDQHSLAWLGIRLSHRQQALLTIIYAAPVLSTAEIAVFFELTPDTVARGLYDLQQTGCIEYEAVRRAQGDRRERRWRLTTLGLRFMAATLHVSLSHVAEYIDDALQQRGLAGLRHTIQHTAGVYGFLATLHQAAWEQGHRIAWWETGGWCERRYHDHGSWHDLRPDAALEYVTDTRRLRLWVEWDQGQMTGAALAVKLHAYAHYTRSREWARELRPLPALLVVTPDLAQEQRMQRLARTCAEAGLIVRTTTASRLAQQGPLAPIWLTTAIDHPHPLRQPLLDEARARSL
jgi:DNA-binding MarR family transcriptional regulator